jgi:hypothetical protein
MYLPNWNIRRRCCTYILRQPCLGGAYAASDALVCRRGAKETWGLVVNEAVAGGLPRNREQRGWIYTGRNRFWPNRGNTYLWLVSELTKILLRLADPVPFAQLRHSVTAVSG